MVKSIEISGKTEDEAIETALEQLSLTRDEVSVEIVERAKTGFLGLKNTPAVVKVLYEAKEDHTGGVEGFLSGLFERMGVVTEMSVSEGEGSINVILSSNDPGALIGRRGETLDAIQHLTNYVVNREGSGRARVNLDAENYRQRRNETLETLATRTAAKVMKYRRNMTLDPMNAYERHIIHAALQEYENISTYSIGSEPNRRIVVAYGRNNEGSGRGGDSSGRGGDSRGHGSDSRGRSSDSRGRSSDSRGRGGDSRGHSGESHGLSSEGGGHSNESHGFSNESHGLSSEGGGHAEDIGRSNTPQYREWR